MSAVKVLEWVRRSADGLKEVNFLYVESFSIGQTVETSGRTYRVKVVPEIGAAFVPESD